MQDHRRLRHWTTSLVVSNRLLRGCRGSKPGSVTPPTRPSPQVQAFFYLFPIVIDWVPLPIVQLLPSSSNRVQQGRRFVDKDTCPNHPYLS